MNLYHGTISTSAENIVQNGILLKKSKIELDFGKGFYTSKYKKFAISTAENKSTKTNSHYKKEYCKPAVLTFQYIETKGLNILNFDKKDLLWAQFIVNNRNGLKYVEKLKLSFHNIDCKYDIVIGDIADNKITTIADELKHLKQKLTTNDLVDILYNYTTNQYSFHTEASLSCIRLVKCDIMEEKKGDVVHEST